MTSSEADGKEIVGDKFKGLRALPEDFMTKIIPSLSFSHLPDASCIPPRRLPGKFEGKEQEIEFEVSAYTNPKKKNKFADIQASSLEHGLVIGSPLNSERTSRRVQPKNFSHSSQASFSAFDWNSRDLISGKSLKELRDDKLSRGKPYVFGRTFLFDKKQSREVVLDGARLVHAFDDDVDEAHYNHEFDIASPMVLNLAGVREMASEPVMFLAYGEKALPISIGGLYGLMSSPLDSMFMNLAVQDYNNWGEEKATRVAIAALFMAGKIVPQDVRYAESLVKNISPKELVVPASACLEVVACLKGDHLEIARALLALGATPHTSSEPLDSSAFVFAEDRNNQSLLSLFEAWEKDALEKVSIQRPPALL